jgi:hypothetical protein
MPGWASTALDGHQEAVSSSMIGVARGSKDQYQHAPAAANPYLACVREEPHHPRRCCSCYPSTKLMLVMLTANIILAGAVLGLGLHLGRNKSEGETPGQGDLGPSNVAHVGTLLM